MRTHPFLRCVDACRSLPATRTRDYASVPREALDGEALAADDGRLVGTFHLGLAWLSAAEISKKPGLARQVNQCIAAPVRLIAGAQRSEP